MSPSRVVGEPQAKLCRILSLDGGGAKGFYTLGALKEIEGLSGRKLCETFDLVFGTSTGAIIAALVGLGFSVDDILELYRKHVIKVMARWLPSRKTAALEELAEDGAASETDAAETAVMETVESPEELDSVVSKPENESVTIENAESSGQSK